MDAEKGIPANEAPSPKEIEATSSPVPPTKQNTLQRLVHRKNDLNELGKDMLRQSLQYDEAQLEADAIKVRKRLDFLVLPMMMVTYMLSFLDKQTLNYSNAYGLQQDTRMNGNDYAWVASALYFGWLLGAWPWNLFLQRFPIAKVIGYMLFVWGAICMLQAAVFDFGGFFAIRFFLGMMEACISPAWVLLTSLLWTRSEQTLRSSYWLSVNGFSAILGALLAYGTGHAEGLALPNWKLIYLIVGAITFLWGFVIIAYLPDGPHNAKMLSDYERVVAVWRVSKNQIGLKHAVIKPHQILEAFLDGKCYLIWGFGIAMGILNGGVSNFASAIIKGFGFDGLRASLLQTPGGAFQMIGCIALGYFSQLPNMLGVAIMVGCLPGVAGLIGILTIPIEQRYALTACAWLQSIVGSPIILSWSVSAVNVAGHTKRTVVMGTYFALYCVGNIAGPHLFLDREVPRYPTAIKGLLGTYCVAIVLQAVYTFWCWVENKRRDKQGLHAEVKEQELLEGFEDLTDKENKHFRYRL